MKVSLDGSCRTHTDDGLYAVEVVELVSVDTDGRHTHTVTHHTDTFTFIGAGEAQHATHVVELDRVLEELLCHEFYTQRIACHDYGFGDVAIVGPDVGRWSFCCHKLI